MSIQRVQSSLQAGRGNIVALVALSGSWVGGTPVVVALMCESTSTLSGRPVQYNRLQRVGCSALPRKSLVSVEVGVVRTEAPLCFAAAPRFWPAHIYLAEHQHLRWSPTALEVDVTLP